MFEYKWNYKNISIIILFSLFINLLSTLQATLFGLKIHFFQYLIFLSAFIYGPIGGIISGGLGSVYTAIALHNPYVIVGNIILGFFFGVFIQRKFNFLIAALFAYAMQMPWLFYTDVYLIGMPVKAVQSIMLALLFSNIIWAALAKVTIWKNSHLILLLKK